MLECKCSYGENEQYSETKSYLQKISLKCKNIDLIMDNKQIEAFLHCL